MKPQFMDVAPVDMQHVIRVCQCPTPCGILVLGSYGDKLCLCDWQTSRKRDAVNRRLQRMLRAGVEEGTSETIAMAICQLNEYFAGKRQMFDVPLLFVGTAFQREVWNRLLSIPYGQTVSYASLATRVGRPRAVRAVANANGLNALAIFAPCHRVIGSDGSLTGYAGGLGIKQRLLWLESECLHVLNRPQE